MNEVLRKALAERARAAQPSRVDVDALVAQGEKRLRHRRFGAVAGSVLAVALAVGVPAAVVELRDEPRSVEQPKPPEPTKKVDEDVEPAARPLVYAEGSVLHVGDKEIDTGLTPALVPAQAAFMTGKHVPEAKIMNGFYRTDDGAVFTTMDGRVWFSDGTSVQHIGGVPRTRKKSDTPEPAPDGALVDASIETDDAGSRVVWLEHASGDQIELVVYDTAERAVGSRLVLPLPPGADARFTDIYGDQKGMYGDHVYWNRYTGGNGPVQTQLMRTVVSTSTHEPATRAMLAAEQRAQARTLVVGRGKNAQVVSVGDFASADPDVSNFRLSGSRLEFGLFDDEFPGASMPIFNPVSGKQLRFRAPANLQIEELVLFEWLDDDRFVLSTRPALSESERRDFVVCRVSTERCEVTLRKRPGPFLVLPKVGIPG